MFDQALNRSSARPSFRRLFMLRSVILCGQVGAVAAAGFWLHCPPPAAVLAAILSILLLINVASWPWLRQRAMPRLLFAQILVDIAALSLLFYFTGGATNPLVWLLLLSITIAATVLSRLQTWLIALAAVAAYSLLMVIYRPLPGVYLPAGSGFALHIFGMWLGFILSAVLIAHFVAGMAANVRERDRALARAREQALRDERLVSLGILAASAAHELGTPLNTMAILTRELTLDLEAGATDDAHGKLATMRGEIRRCKRTLAGIAASTGADAAQSANAVEVAAFLQTTVEEWRARRGNVRLVYRRSRSAPHLRLVAEQSLGSALANVFDNAADASPDHVEIDADWTNDTLMLCVADRGPGVESGLRHRIGKTPLSAKADGHGLGLYLSQGIIGRLGGNLSIRPRDGGGTAVEVRLPLAGLKV
jgi:two-component system sensor histidine kinase RegB